MKRTARDWRVQYQKDEGFTLRLEETRFWGEVASRVMYWFDWDWWGRYKNLPFCWINPWGWTWKVGTEDHNLGTLWMDVGQKLCRLAEWLPRFEETAHVSVSNDWVRENLPDAWKDFGFFADPSVPSPWDDDNEEKDDDAEAAVPGVPGDDHGADRGVRAG